VKRTAIGVVRRAVVGVACVSATIAVTGSASATTRYTADALNEPAAPGLAVTGALSGFHASSHARVIVPADWRTLPAAGGGLRFQSRESPGCTYAIAFSVRSLLATQTALAFVAGSLPSTDPRRLLDSGQRRSSAFRVVRPASTGGVVHIVGLWASVLTRRADIVPAGEVALSEIAVEATSLPHQDCGSGTYRDVLGPELGDALAAAHTELHIGT
jgi:hypothetical protein